MRAFLIGLILLTFSRGLAQSLINEDGFKNEIFKPGEELTYKASFLGITSGSAITRVDKTYHKILGANCYKVDVYGETSEWLSWVTRVKDNWVSYMDTTKLLTRATYRRIREGRYRKDEWVTFNQDTH